MNNSWDLVFIENFKGINNRISEYANLQRTSVSSYLSKQNIKDVNNNTVNIYDAINYSNNSIENVKRYIFDLIEANCSNQNIFNLFWSTAFDFDKNSSTNFWQTRASGTQSENTILSFFKIIFTELYKKGLDEKLTNNYTYLYNLTTLSADELTRGVQNLKTETTLINQRKAASKFFISIIGESKLSVSDLQTIIDANLGAVLTDDVSRKAFILNTKIIIINRLKEIICKAKFNELKKELYIECPKLFLSTQLLVAPKLSEEIIAATFSNFKITNPSEQYTIDKGDLKNAVSLVFEYLLQRSYVNRMLRINKSNTGYTTDSIYLGEFQLFTQDMDYANFIVRTSSDFNYSSKEHVFLKIPIKHYKLSNGALVTPSEELYFVLKVRLSWIKEGARFEFRTSLEEPSKFVGYSKQFESSSIDPYKTIIDIIDASTLTKDDAIQSKITTTKLFFADKSFFYNFAFTKINQFDTIGKDANTWLFPTKTEVSVVFTTDEEKDPEKCLLVIKCMTDGKNFSGVGEGVAYQLNDNSTAAIYIHKNIVGKNLILPSLPNLFEPFSKDKPVTINDFSRVEAKDYTSFRNNKELTFKKDSLENTIKDKVKITIPSEAFLISISGDFIQVDINSFNYNYNALYNVKIEKHISFTFDIITNPDGSQSIYPKIVFDKNSIYPESISEDGKGAAAELLWSIVFGIIGTTTGYYLGKWSTRVLEDEEVNIERKFNQLVRNGDLEELNFEEDSLFARQYMNKYFDRPFYRRNMLNAINQLQTGNQFTSDILGANEVILLKERFAINRVFGVTFPGIQNADSICMIDVEAAIKRKNVGQLFAHVEAQYKLFKIKLYYAHEQLQFRIINASDMLPGPHAVNGMPVYANPDNHLNHPANEEGAVNRFPRRAFMRLLEDFKRNALRYKSTKKSKIINFANNFQTVFFGGATVYCINKAVTDISGNTEAEIRRIKNNGDITNFKEFINNWCKLTDWNKTEFYTVDAIGFESNYVKLDLEPNSLRRPRLLKRKDEWAQWETLRQVKNDPETLYQSPEELNTKWDTIYAIKFSIINNYLAKLAQNKFFLYDNRSLHIKVNNDIQTVVSEICNEKWTIQKAYKAAATKDLEEKTLLVVSEVGSISFHNETTNQSTILENVKLQFTIQLKTIENIDNQQTLIVHDKNYIIGDFTYEHDTPKLTALDATKQFNNDTTFTNSLIAISLETLYKKRALELDLVFASINYSTSIKNKLQFLQPTYMRIKVSSTEDEGVLSLLCMINNNAPPPENTTVIDAKSLIPENCESVFFMHEKVLLKNIVVNALKNVFPKSTIDDFEYSDEIVSYTNKVKLDYGTLGKIYDKERLAQIDKEFNENQDNPDKLKELQKERDSINVAISKNIVPDIQPYVEKGAFTLSMVHGGVLLQFDYLEFVIKTALPERDVLKMKHRISRFGKLAMDEQGDLTFHFDVEDKFQLNRFETYSEPIEINDSVMRQIFEGAIITALTMIFSKLLLTIVRCVPRFVNVTVRSITLQVDVELMAASRWQTFKNLWRITDFNAAYFDFKFIKYALTAINGGVSMYLASNVYKRYVKLINNWKSELGDVDRWTLNAMSFVEWPHYDAYRVVKGYQVTGGFKIGINVINDQLTPENQQLLETLKRDKLVLGEYMEKGESLYSADEKLRFTFDYNGNLVLQKKAANGIYKMVWDSFLFKPATHLFLTTNLNQNGYYDISLVLKNVDEIIWQSQVFSTNKTQIVESDYYLAPMLDLYSELSESTNFKLVIKSRLSSEETKVNHENNAAILMPKDKLLVGEKLYSRNRLYYLIVQQDRNVVIYKKTDQGDSPIWATDTKGKSRVTEFCFQEDGNLCLYTKSGECVWSPEYTGKRIAIYNKGGAYAKLENNGELVIRNNNDDAIWSSINGVNDPKLNPSLIPNYSKLEISQRLFCGQYLISPSKTYLCLIDKDSILKVYKIKIENNILVGEVSWRISEPNIFSNPISKVSPEERMRLFPSYECFLAFNTTGKPLGDLHIRHKTLLNIVWTPYKNGNSIYDTDAKLMYLDDFGVLTLLNSKSDVVWTSDNEKLMDQKDLDVRRVFNRYREPSFSKIRTIDSPQKFIEDEVNAKRVVFVL
jgi:hypothetical protein